MLTNIMAIHNCQQIIEHADDDVVAVGLRMPKFCLYFLEQPLKFFAFISRTHQKGRCFGLLAVLQTIDKELVGNKRSHKILAEYQKFVVESRLIDVPLLLLVRLHDEHHAVFQGYLPVVYQHIAISFLDEKYFEEVGLEHFMLREHPRALASISCVDVEIYAAIRLAERHFYQTLSLLCHNLNMLFYAKVHFLADLSKWHNRRMKWYK